ncbi:MAG: DUF2799 domain-containing protein [Pseudomonadota bacterium]
MSESQCAVGDWETIGYRDGVNGQRSTRLLAHQDACMKHGFSPDREEYMLGWEQGVREYCDPNNGFHIGSRGGNHANVCPSDLKAGFLTAYRDGKTLYDARLAVANLEWEIDQKTNRLAEVKSQIVSVAAAQLSTELTAADRIELGDQLRRLYEEQELLKDEIPELEARLADKSRELDALNRAMASLTPVVGSVP